MIQDVFSPESVEAIQGLQAGGVDFNGTRIVSRDGVLLDCNENIAPQIETPGSPVQVRFQHDGQRYVFSAVSQGRVCRNLPDGHAAPRDLERIIGHVDRTLGLEHMGVHLHDLHGLGLVNSLIAYEMGIRTFDCSIGGLGGNKIVENSVGNVATEELVNMFHGMDVATGIDFDFLIRAGRIIVDMARYVGDPAPPSRILADRLVGLEEVRRRMAVV